MVINIQKFRQERPLHGLRKTKHRQKNHGIKIPGWLSSFHGFPLWQVLFGKEVGLLKGRRILFYALDKKCGPLPDGLPKRKTLKHSGPPKFQNRDIWFGPWTKIALR